MNCDILKIVRGNDFATQMTITALDAGGNVIEDFSLEDSTEVVVRYTLAGTSHTIEAYDYDIEGNDITIQWSDLALGKYGIEIEGKFNGYSWRSAARFIFQIVSDNASANIPDGVLVDGVYKLSDWLRLLSGGGGGIKQVQADWTETDTNSPAYIQNKPELAPVATSGSYNDLTNKPTIPDVSGKADKVSGAVAGDFAGLDANGNLTDSGKKASDFATAEQGAKADTAIQQVKTINNQSIVGEGNIEVGGDVESVNGKTGVVVLNATDVGAARQSTTYTKTEVDAALGAKQNTLVSGINIKTINDQSILGSGNIIIEGGEGGETTESLFTEETDWGRYTTGTQPGSLGPGQVERIGTTDYVYETSTTRITNYPKKVIAKEGTLKIQSQSGYKSCLSVFNKEVNERIYFSQWQTGEIYYEVTTWLVIVVNFAKEDNSTITTEDYNKISVTLSYTSSNQSELPSYWQSYLDSKMASINDEDTNIGLNGCAFAFVTDTHVEDNAMYSPKLIKYINEHTSIKDTYFGGDAIKGYRSTKLAGLADLYTWRNATDKLKIANVLGNHDYNGNLQTNADAIISESDFYSVMCRPQESFVRYGTGHAYGYIDNESQKIRIILLNTEGQNQVGQNPDTVPMNTSQIDWMKDRINELEAGWSVIVVCHRMFTFDWAHNYITYDVTGTQIKTALDSIYDTCNAEIVCVISGHTHDDMARQSSKGYWIIATTTDAYKQTNYDGTLWEQSGVVHSVRTSGTTTEQAFDLFFINTLSKTIKAIRIGYGSDRSFNYGTTSE